MPECDWAAGPALAQQLVCSHSYCVWLPNSCDGLASFGPRHFGKTEALGQQNLLSTGVNTAITPERKLWTVAIHYPTSQHEHMAFTPKHCPFQHTESAPTQATSHHESHPPLGLITVPGFYWATEEDITSCCFRTSTSLSFLRLRPLGACEVVDLNWQSSRQVLWSFSPTVCTRRMFQDHLLHRLGPGFKYGADAKLANNREHLYQPQPYDPIPPRLPQDRFLSKARALQSMW